VPRELRPFVERSLQLLEREAPHFHARVCLTLRGRRVLVGGLAGSGERPFALSFDGGMVDCVEPDGAEDVHFGIDRVTILALVDGEWTLEHALREERFDVRGRLGDVADLFDGWLAYVRGAIRCPSFPQLLSEFRADSPEYQHEV
jgi:hypothetical protein